VLPLLQWSLMTQGLQVLSLTVQRRRGRRWIPLVPWLCSTQI
jgi:hypothetical protein